MPFEEALKKNSTPSTPCDFKGVFFLTQKLLPLIADGGRIVNVSTRAHASRQSGGAVYARSRAPSKSCRGTWRWG